MTSCGSRKTKPHLQQEVYGVRVNACTIKRVSKHFTEKPVTKAITVQRVSKHLEVSLFIMLSTGEPINTSV